MTSSSDDPTVFRPIPGGRPPEFNSAARPKLGGDPELLDKVPRLGCLNPVEHACSGLLALLTYLNTSIRHFDPDALKTKIISEIQEFQKICQSLQVDFDTISSTRYVLCTALDEAIMNKPWGIKWSEESLLAKFHGDVDGGVQFFRLMESLAQNPKKNRNLLEIMYICLAIGFEGRYRIIENGKDKLARIREWLYGILQKERGIAEPALSPHWQGVTDRRNPLARIVPWWVFGALAAALLAVIYAFFLFKLAAEADPVIRQIKSVRLPEAEIRPATTEHAPPPTPAPTLTVLLKDEISGRKVKIDETDRQGSVTLQNENLFASGSAAVNQNSFAVLTRIAEELEKLDGSILITGYTDNVPIAKSLRYPSNWQLSEARAEAVADVIRTKLTKPQRVATEGKADLDPVGDNRTAEGRAKNRRVTITLIKSPT